MCLASVHTLCYIAVCTYKTVHAALNVGPCVFVLMIWMKCLFCVCFYIDMSLGSQDWQTARQKFDIAQTVDHVVGLETAAFVC